jgi:hypothetical protein
VGSQGIAFDPLTSGTTTLSATIPGFISQPLANRDVTVSAPAITVYAGAVGAGLQTQPYVYLGVATQGGVTLRLESSAPGVLQLSPDAVTPGAASIDIQVPDGTQYVYYHVQGVQGQTGTVTITASAPGFTDGSNAWDVVQPALSIISLNPTTTAGAANDPFQVRVGIAGGSGVGTVQGVSATVGTLTATITSGTPSSGTLTTSAGTAASRSIQISTNAYDSPPTLAAGGIEFDPLMSGSTTLSATIPGFIATPDATRVVTVNPDP